MRINKLDHQTIIRMSPDVLETLTNSFEENLVTKVVARAKTNDAQRQVIRTIKRGYKEIKKNAPFPTWDLLGGAYPDFMNRLELDIECGEVIKDKEEEQKKKFEKISDNLPASFTQEDLDNNNANKLPPMLRIKELEAKNKRLSDKNKELEEENKQLKNAPPAQKEDDEVKRLTQEKEEMTIELLMPIFYNKEQDVREFLEKIDCRPDTEITDTVHEWVKARKISEKSKGRALWSILHAAKYYSSTESNWNTALRNHPK